MSKRNITAIFPRTSEKNLTVHFTFCSSLTNTSLFYQLTCHRKEIQNEIKSFYLLIYLLYLKPPPSKKTPSGLVRRLNSCVIYCMVGSLSS